MIDPFYSHREFIFKDGYDNCKEANGILYFDSYNTFICLTSPNGVIDFSNSTEIVGTNFSKRNYKDLGDNKYSYSWEICDKNNTRYNHESCMKEASYLSAIESMDFDIIQKKLICEEEENVLNHFYYQKNKDKIDYACIERYPTYKFTSSFEDINNYYIPPECMIKDGEFNCQFMCEINGKTLRNYKKPNSEKLKLYDEGVQCLEAIETMTKAEKISTPLYTLTKPVVNSVTVKPSMTATLTGYGVFSTNLPVEAPENVSKMVMFCKYYDRNIPSELCFHGKTPTNLECYQLYKRVEEDLRCDVYTLNSEPYLTTTVTYGKPTTVPYYTQIPATSCAGDEPCYIPTYTMQSFSETFTLTKNIPSSPDYTVPTITNPPTTTLKLPTEDPFSFFSDFCINGDCSNLPDYNWEGWSFGGYGGFEGIDIPALTPTPTPTTTSTTSTSSSTSTVFWSEKLGYPRCSSCKVVYTDDDGDWGVHNGEWCGIDKESCK